MLRVIKTTPRIQEEEDLEKGGSEAGSDSSSEEEDDALAFSGMQLNGSLDFGVSDTKLKHKQNNKIEMKHLKTGSSSRQVTFKRNARPRSMVGDVFVDDDEEEKAKEEEEDNNEDPSSKLQKGVSGLKRIFKRSHTTTQVIQGTLNRTRKRKKSKEFVVLDANEGEERILLITGHTKDSVRTVNLAQALEESRMHLRQGCFWIDFQGLELTQVQAVALEFGIHPLTVEDIVDGASREKSECFEKGYLCTSISEAHLEKAKKEINLVEVTILLFPSFLLTFHASPVKSLEKALLSVQESGAGEMPPPDWITYAIEDSIVDMYSVFVSQIRDKVESLEELAILISGRRQRDVLKTINSLRRSVSDMRAQLFSKRDLLRVQLKQKEGDFIRSSTKVYLRSLFDQITQLLLVLDMASETVNNTNNTYLARISVEMAEASQQLGELMKRFSSVGLILLPLSLVAGIWGMNVKVPGQEDDNLFWFGGIVSFMVAYAVILTTAFFHFDWL